mmetsp:Transcript_3011/g.6775  ORF Transcript_3011/g.6775 Transcript_3011/m.6775 type:complete len:117 (-) Transcript_3011:169-519(-)
MASIVWRITLVALMMGVKVDAWTTTKTAITTRRSIATKSPSCVYSSSSSSSSSDASDSTSDDGDDTTQQDNSWLETWALEGAEKIASLDINERTQRAMLAEICEDEIYQLTIGKIL